MRKLKRVLLDIARENTGEHICDSGGAYGRAYQKAQKQTDSRILKEPKQIKDEPKEINAFNYLLNNLKITPESENFNEDFKKFQKKSEEYNMTDMEIYAEKHNQKDNYLCEEIKVNNTYNCENVLSEVLQYIIFCSNERYFIILQIHRGCDVRGGYSTPQIFEVEDIECFISEQYTEEE